MLKVSRAFGDSGHKRDAQAGQLIATPDAHTQQVDPADEFLIIACDGVWDVLTDDDAVALVRAVAPDGGDAAEAERTAAERLVGEALRRGSTDNITAMVVFL